MFYVYAYLRDGGSPYYIGKGKNYRAWSHDHSIKLPNNRNRIVIMESNLSEIGALALERFYIRWYGRKDLNTGILRNITDGGEGCSPSIETRLKMSLANKNQIPWSKGKNLSAEHKRKIGLANKGISKNVGNKNIKYEKGFLIEGKNNPNVKKWKLIINNLEIIIEDLVNYCKINNLNYHTVYSWQQQKINNIPRLQKV